MVKQRALARADLRTEPSGGPQKSIILRDSLRFPRFTGSTNAIPRLSFRFWRFRKGSGAGGRGVGNCEGVEVYKSHFPSFHLSLSVMPLLSTYMASLLSVFSLVVRLAPLNANPPQTRRHLPDFLFPSQASVAALGPSSVDLGTAANYAILAQTGVSSVPESTISEFESPDPPLPATFLLLFPFEEGKKTNTIFFSHSSRKPGYV